MSGVTSIAPSSATSVTPLRFEGTTQEFFESKETTSSPKATKTNADQTSQDASPATTGTNIDRTSLYSSPATTETNIDRAAQDSSPATTETNIDRAAQDSSPATTETNIDLVAQDSSPATTETNIDRTSQYSSPTTTEINVDQTSSPAITLINTDQISQETTERMAEGTSFEPSRVTIEQRSTTSAATTPGITEGKYLQITTNGLQQMTSDGAVQSTNTKADSTFLEITTNDITSQPRQEVTSEINKSVFTSPVSSEIVPETSTSKFGKTTLPPAHTQSTTDSVPVITTGPEATSETAFRNIHFSRNFNIADGNI